MSTQSESQEEDKRSPSEHIKLIPKAGTLGEKIITRNSNSAVRPQHEAM
jgi:hypothetical protein